jgi:glucose 1-dehydrogenase
LAPNEPKTLAGKVAIVTGAGGVGTAIAGLLAERGAKVAVVDIDAAAANNCASKIEESGGEALAVVADLRDAAASRAAVSQAAETFAAIDILALAHGLLKTARILELSEDDWDLVLDSNVKGRFLVSQAVARNMIDAKRPGVIIDVGSFTGERPTVGRLHYCAGNAVADTLVRAMAVDLGRYGIRAVSISSGPIATPLLGDRLSNPERLARFLENIPLKRMGRPEDIAEAVAFIASPEARYWSGATVSVDGGWMAG